MKALFFELHESLKLLRCFEANILLWLTLAVLTIAITFTTITTASKIHHHRQSQSHKRNIFAGSQ